MMLSKCGLLLSAVVIFILCSEVNGALNVSKVSNLRADAQPWWTNGVFYQIYPRSFKEKDREKGIGNLQGITDKLQHLKETGITAVWLSQIYKTPNTEHGEDISNFRNIHSDYGKLDDFDNLIKKAQEVDIKVILDFVVNHSGKKHRWFEESEKSKNGKYADYYVWHDGIVGNDGNKLPPNNWLSVYGDSAWELSQPRNQFYLHQFGIEQPDLNYCHPQVIEEMKDVMEFWLKKGVDGFRLDAVPFLFEDDGFKDEPKSDIPNVLNYQHQYLNHIYTMDQKKTYDLIYKLRKFIDDYNDKHPDKAPKILMAEAYSTSIENTIRYYGDKENKGVHVPFNFQLIPHSSDSSAIQIVTSINEWLNKMPEGQTANWLVGNHDHHRVATRFGPELVNNVNILIASLPGVMVTYNGEEIGQEDGEVTYVQCKDPIGCRNGPADFYKVSRDFERTPYHWDGTEKAGFTGSTGDPWLPVSKKHLETNLQKQMDTTESSYKFYKYIISTLRKLKEFTTGEVKVEAISEYVIKITRGSSFTDNGNYVVLINMGEQPEKLKVANDQKGLYYKVVYPTDNSGTEQFIWEKDVIIDAHNSIVLKVISSDVTYDWWRNAVIYQIYLRSFKDEIKNDGIGDFRGIISKLEYLKKLGVNAICLSSIYQSSHKDLGYDVTDFLKIDEIYGTESDFVDLIKFANYHGIRVIIDFVPNHSSINHRWFNENPNYYVTTSESLNNWFSIFKGKAWTTLSTPNKYYLHQFDYSQADLNYRNPSLKNEMQETLIHWLGKGVSGFRMSAAPYLFEDEKFPNEPPSNHLAEDKDTWKSLKHIYTSNLQETFDLIYEWRELLDVYTVTNGGDERIMITDANTDIRNTMYYYGTKYKKGAHLTFNYQLMEKVDGTSTANDFAAKINEWIDLIPDGFTSNWALGNHDKRRVATRFGPKNVDGFNMLTAVLPGVMFTYNGEEIGQEDGVLDVNNCHGDPIFCPLDGQTSSEKEELRELRRDRQRTPFHWNSSQYAGFTKSVKGPWLPVSLKYTETNLEMQMNQNGSHYALYKRLIKLRQMPAFVNGSLKVKAITDYVLTTLRYHTANESYFHLFNLRNEKETFNLRTAYNETTQILEVVETNDHENLPVGTLLNADNTITLQGHQSVIAKFRTTASSATIYAVSSLALLLGLLINLILVNCFNFNNNKFL